MRKPPRKPRPQVRYTPELAERILAALARGQGLRALTRRPGMPTRATIMRWLKTRPDFADEASLARFDGGLGFDGLGPDGRRGRPRGLTPAVDLEIYDRLSAGEPLVSVCRDPRMPSRSTVQSWARADPAFARTLDLARENACWAEADARLAALGLTSFHDLAKAPLPNVPNPRGRGRPRKTDPKP